MFALGHELAQTAPHKFDLAHMRVLLEAMDHPERRFPSVLIAGTNGKGSTAATLASILRASGLKTGLYTSPHLVRINERIQLNGEAISDENFAALQESVERFADRLVKLGDLPWHPSFFEMMTAIAFEHFAREKVEIAVLEVGMGGRLDATNVVEPLVSVITDISLDHQKYLGNTVVAVVGGTLMLPSLGAVRIPASSAIVRATGRPPRSSRVTAASGCRPVPGLARRAGCRSDASAWGQAVSSWTMSTRSGCPPSRTSRPGWARASSMTGSKYSRRPGRCSCVIIRRWPKQ